MKKIENGVYESTWCLSICVIAIWLAKQAVKIPTTDGRSTIISKLAVIGRLRRRYRGFLEELQKTHGALETNDDPTSGHRSHTHDNNAHFLWRRLATSSTLYDKEDWNYPRLHLQQYENLRTLQLRQK